MNDQARSPLLVFGDDGAEASDRAWRWITAHDWPGWTVEVLSADESNIDWGKAVRFETWEPPWTREPDVRGAKAVTFLAASTDPRAMLADVPADLVVLGIKEAGQLAAVMTGSTTEWLLHHPPSPIVIVRRPAPVTNVMVCTDGSVHAERAITVLASLPLAGRCAVTVVSINDGRADPNAASRALDLLEPHVASVATTPAKGMPTEVILRLVDETAADLVVLGTRGLTGWKRLRLGSTASAIVRSVACDCLVACSDDED